MARFSERNESVRRCPGQPSTTALVLSLSKDGPDVTSWIVLRQAQDEGEVETKPISRKPLDPFRHERSLAAPRRGPAVAAVVAVLLASVPAHGIMAQTPRAENSAAPAQAAAPQPPPDLDARKRDLQGVEDTLLQSEAQRHRIAADIEQIRTDRVRLNAALIETTGRVHEAETKAGIVESRLDTLTGSEDAIKQSLTTRRGVIVEVLASLQRMARKPPPAILVAPADILDEAGARCMS